MESNLRYMLRASRINLQLVTILERRTFCLMNPVLDPMNLEVSKLQNRLLSIHLRQNILKYVDPLLYGMS